MDIASHHDLLGIPAELLDDDDAITEFMAMRSQARRWESYQLESLAGMFRSVSKALESQ